MRNRIALLLALSLLSGCSWITEYFRGDENAEPPTPLTEIKNQIKVEQVWSASTGGDNAEQLLRLVPAIDAEHVYVVSRNGKIHAFDLENGKTIWESDAKTQVSAGPAVGSGILMIGTRNAEVLAFDLEKGSLLWREQVSSEVLSVPTLKNDVAVVRTIDGRVTGINIGTGKKVWEYRKQEPTLTLRGTSRPVISGNHVFIGFDNGQLVSLSLYDGREVWTQEIAIPEGRSELDRIIDLDANPVVQGDIIYASAYQGNVAAVSTIDGQVMWKRKMSSYEGQCVAGKQLFVTDDSSDVWALNINTGASTWKQDGLQWRTLTAPACIGRYIVLGDFEGYLHWLSQDDGKIVARVRGDHKGLAMPPVISGNKIVTLGNGGELSVFQLIEP